MKRVFVTGLGVVSPIGIGVEAFSQSLKAGKSGVRNISTFNPEKHTVKIAAEVDGFDPTPYITKKEIRRHDRFSQFAMAASHMAISQANLTAETWDPKRICVMIATGIGGIHTLENEHDVYLKSGPSRVSPFLVPMMICNIASGCVAITHKFKGPNYTVVSACASAIHGIGEAYLKLVFGQCDIAVTGGSESAITPLTVAGFAQMRALSTRNDQPERASRPFDRDRDGFVMGEGAGCLVLETEEAMRKRGSTPIVEIIGYGASTDAHHLTEPEPEGEGALQAMTEALAFNQTPTEKLSYVNAHGTSTPKGDVVETLAIKRLLGDRAGKVPVNSTKSMIGHLLGAAGAVASIATVIQMKDGFLHPTINLENPGDGCDLDYVPREAREQKIEYAIVNAFGFGGHNGSLLFKNV